MEMTNNEKNSPFIAVITCNGFENFATEFLLEKPPKTFYESSLNKDRENGV